MEHLILGPSEHAPLERRERQEPSFHMEGQPEPYILNATRLVDCIDDVASKHVERWVPEDADAPPERAGEYRNVVGMRLDTSRVEDAKVFRPWGWTVVLVVSEDLKDALERTGATGMTFTAV